MNDESVLPTKTCIHCRETKSLDKFVKDKRLMYGKSNICLACHNSDARAWANTDYGKRYHQRATAEWKANNPDRQHHNTLVRKYGISLDDYKTMWEKQEGKCPICGSNLVAGKLTHVDHCHSTGKVRGLLCSPCNRALGAYERRAVGIAAYLNIE